MDRYIPTQIMSGKHLPYLYKYKEIYIGHTMTLSYGTDYPINRFNVWMMDTGAAFNGRISAINIETKEIFQSKPIRSLYPNEMGRNKS